MGDKSDRKLKKQVKKAANMIIDAHINSTCYFCDDNKITQKHHIVPRKEEGMNHKLNLINLCLKCHYIIHHRNHRIFFVSGYFVLVNLNHKNITLDQIQFPSEKQIGHERENPFEYH